MKRREVLASLATLTASPWAIGAGESPPATVVPPLLRISGPGPARFEFTEAAFLALPTASITTATVWTPRSVFVGPTLLTVMRAAGVTGGTLIFRTLDDYSAPIPWSDLVRYGVILAHSQDGQRLNNKRWGPLWTMYPRDRYPRALSGPIAESRFIWQVNRIEVKA